jgi:hypothetical protein
LPLKGRKCEISCIPVTPKASPATVGNQEEQHIQPIGNKKKVKEKFWSVRVKGRYRDRKWKSENS